MRDLFLLSEGLRGTDRTIFPLAHGVTRVDDRHVSGIVFMIKNSLR